MNILVVCAHPDDVEVFCAGTLIKYYRQGHKIFLALTTSGNTGSNAISCKKELAETREREQCHAMEAIDAQIRFLRFEDEGLQDSAATRRAVLTAIRWANPDIIFTNPPQDGSTDHAMTGQLVTRVILSVGGKLHTADLPPTEKQPQIFFFTTATCVDFAPRAFVDVSDVMEEKCRMLRCHESQYAWMKEFSTEDICDSMCGNNRMMGIRAGYRYAEGFVAFNAPGYRGNYRLLP